MIAGPHGPVCEHDLRHAGSRQVVGVQGHHAIDLHAVARYAVRQDDVAGGVGHDLDLRSGQAGCKLQRGRRGCGGIVASALVDLELAIARAVHERVGAAMALLVVLAPGRRAFPVKDHGAVAAVQAIGTDCACSGQDEDLAPAPDGAVGEDDLRDAGSGHAAVIYVHDAVDLHLVAGSSVGQVDPVAVRGDSDVCRGDAGAKAQHRCGRRRASVVLAFADLEVSVSRIEHERVRAASALLVVLAPSRRPLAVEGVCATRAVERIRTSRSRGGQGGQLIAGPNGAVSEGDLRHAEAGHAAGAERRHAVDLHAVARRAISQDDTALGVGGDAYLGSRKAGPKLQRRLGRVRGLALVDFQLAIAWIEDEGVGTAVALLVILTSSRRALAVERVGTARAKQGVGARRADVDEGGDLGAGPDRAIGEDNLGHARCRLAAGAEVHHAVDLHPVARGSVGQDDVAGAVRGDGDLGSRDACGKLQRGRGRNPGALALIDFQMAVARRIDEGVGSTIALQVVFTAGWGALAVEDLRTCSADQVIGLGRTVNGGFHLSFQPLRYFLSGARDTCQMEHHHTPVSAAIPF